MDRYNLIFILRLQFRGWSRNTAEDYLLNDQINAFSVKPVVYNYYVLSVEVANIIAPKNIMLNSMSTEIVEKGGKLFLASDSRGGPLIPKTIS